MSSQWWEVIGGADKGGILVREGRTPGTPKLEERLATGALVEELELVGERLHYVLREGAGPEEGWVSIAVNDKELLKKVDAPKSADSQVFLKFANGEHTVAAYERYISSWHGEVQDIPAPKVTSNLIEYTEKRVAMMHSGNFSWEVTGPKAVPGRTDDPDFEVMRARSKKNKERLKDDPTMVPLPPWQKLKMAEVKKLAKKTLPGEIYGLLVPPNLESFYNFGASWLTKAFHAAGSLPKDNSVKSVLDFKRLPMSGRDAQGGSGPKAFMTVEYEKPPASGSGASAGSADDTLHTELFIKMPWSTGGEGKDMGGDDLWRWRISCHQDNDGQEVSVYRMLEPLFPFRIPKYYFADICRENTNYILITEKVAFGKRGQTEFKPYEIMPLAEKYFDFQLDSDMQTQMYYCLMRAQGRMAAWNAMGYFDCIPHETRGYHMAPPGLGHFPWPLQIPQEKRDKDFKSGREVLKRIWESFIGPTGCAKQAYPSEFSQPAFFNALMECVIDAQPYRDDVNHYCFLFPELVGMMHQNLQSDNAYYWRNEDGKLDAGLIDWGGLSPGCLSSRMMGCITSALGEVLDYHEEGLLQAWIDEYTGETGVEFDFSEVKRQWELQYCGYLYSCGMNIMQEVFRECPEAEWHTITTLMDDRCAGRWNCRCYVYMILHMLKFLWLRWKRGGSGRLHCHKTFLEWRDYWATKGMTVPKGA